MWASSEFGGLGAHVGSSGHEDAFDALAGSYGLELLVQLECEFAGRGQDHSEDAHGVSGPFLQDRHCEGDCFTRTSAGTTYTVAA